MNREEFYKRKVLSDSEYNELAGDIEDVQERVNDLLDDFRGIIKNFMSNLWEKAGSSEFKVEQFTIINRFGAIGVINSKVDDVEELDIDEISDVDVFYELTSYLI